MTEHVYRINGQRVCWATNPGYPNRDGRARGRVWHLEHLDKTRFDYKATQCGALVDVWVRPIDVSIASRRICDRCIIETKKWRERETTAPSDLAEVVESGADCCWIGDKNCPEHGGACQ